VSVGRGWGPRASVIYDCGGDPRSEASGTVQRTDSEDRTHSETRQLPTRLETCARCAGVYVRACVRVCARVFVRVCACACVHARLCECAYPYNVTAAVDQSERRTVGARIWQSLVCRRRRRRRRRRRHRRRRRRMNEPVCVAPSVVWWGAGERDRRLRTTYFVADVVVSYAARSRVRVVAGDRPVKALAYTRL